jgi:hypothetical protein
MNHAIHKITTQMELLALVKAWVLLFRTAPRMLLTNSAYDAQDNMVFPGAGCSVVRWSRFGLTVEADGQDVRLPWGQPLMVRLETEVAR